MKRSGERKVMTMLVRLVTLIWIAVASGVGWCQVPFQDMPKDKVLRDSMIDLAMGMVRTPGGGNPSPSPRDIHRLAELVAWSGHADHARYLAANHLRAEERAHILGALAISLLEQGDQEAAVAIARTVGEDNGIIPNGTGRADADMAAAGSLVALGLKQEALGYLVRGRTDPGTNGSDDARTRIENLRGARIAALQAYGDRIAADTAWAELQADPSLRASSNLVQVRAQRLAFDGDYVEALQTLAGTPALSFTATDVR